jgi:hypothetical protein
MAGHKTQTHPTLARKATYWQKSDCTIPQHNSTGEEEKAIIHWEADNDHIFNSEQL